MKNVYRIVFAALAAVIMASILSFATLADSDPFDGLPVIYVANESKGTGDGSTPENAMGNADDYVPGYPQNEGGKYIDQTSKTALARAYAALGNNGGTIVIVDELVINACDTKRSSPAEYTIGATGDYNPYRITSVYNGIDYGENGAKLVIDQTDNPALGIRFRVPMTLENLTIDYKYTTGNDWYGNNKSNGTKPTVLIAFWGKGGVIGEGVVCNSVPGEGAIVTDAKLSLIAGDRYLNFSSADLTVKSGSWYMVTGTHGMTEAYPGKISGDVNITVEGGEIEYLFGEGTLDTAHSKWASVNGSVYINVGRNARVGYASGSYANKKADFKTLEYDVNAIKSENIHDFDSVVPVESGPPDKPRAETPAAPVVKSFAGTSVTLEKVEGLEYSLNKETWQDGAVFTGLKPLTGYTFYCRVKETEDVAASLPSEGTSVTTGKLALAGTFSVSGRPEVGSKVTVRPEDPSLRGLDLVYKWTLDGNAVEGAIYDNYTVSYSDVGKTLAVEATSLSGIEGKITGEIGEITLVYPDSCPVITVDDALVKQGGTVRLPVRITGNSGIDIFVLTPVLPEGTELIGVENGAVFGTMERDANIVFDRNNRSIINGVIAYITVSVSSSATGYKSVSLKVRECVDSNGDTVVVRSTDGVLTVGEVRFGDATGDNKVTSLDLIRLKKHLANGNVAVGDGADVNCDGKVDALDVAKLKRYFAEYDVKTGKSTVVLGKA